MSNPNPTSGGPPLRALAMVLIALAIVFGGLGAMSLSSADTDDSQADAPTSTASQAPATTAAPAPSSAASDEQSESSGAASSTQATPTTTTAAPTTTPVVAQAVPVRVLNNSMVAGLAGKTADQLTSQGFQVIETGNYGGSILPTTTVYYGHEPGAQETAQRIADELGGTAQPDSGTAGGSGTGVTVIVTGQ